MMSNFVQSEFLEDGNISPNGHSKCGLSSHPSPTPLFTQEDVEPGRSLFV